MCWGLEPRGEEVLSCVRACMGLQVSISGGANQRGGQRGFTSTTEGWRTQQDVLSRKIIRGRKSFSESRIQS